jgi:hypothetical protein
MAGGQASRTCDTMRPLPGAGREGTDMKAALAPLAAALALLAVVPPADEGRFPLRVSQNHRHLEDASGRPFLVVGDAAWSLIAQLDAADAGRYLDDRAARGFTALIVNLIEHKFATHAPANLAGEQPFEHPGDFTHPRAAYFDAAHGVVEEAGRRGLSVWLCPAYLGWDGGDEGFYKDIAAAGPSALHAYGRFVGDRFKDLPNLVWMPGGDYALAPKQRWVVETLVSGLREGGATQIMSAHGGQTSAVATYGDQPWLDVETVYSYKPDLMPQLLDAYGATPARPFVLIESTYEGEHDVTAAQVRRQAWASMLAGAAGQFFGNNPIWHFDGPTLFPFTGTWQDNLDRPGSRDMSRLAAFFRASRWEALQPVAGKELAPGSGHLPAVSAARTDTGGLIVYVPSDGTTHGRELLIPQSVWAGARWVNPAADEAPRPVLAAGSSARGVRVATPGDNGTGAGDWVLDASLSGQAR